MVVLYHSHAPDNISPMNLGEFQEHARTWLTENKSVAPRDYGAILPPDMREEGMAWQAALFAAGFAGIHWPEEYGGRGLPPEFSSAWVVECARAQVPPFINMVGVVLTGGSILMFGTPEQKEQHLRSIISGEQVWCQLFSEPDAGSDLAALQTRAVRDGDEWVVTGQKVWCSNGRIADWGILLARTDHDAPKHKGISFFLIDMKSPGVEVRPLRQITGDAEFDEVFLTDVRLPADALLGPINEGWNVAMATLTNERGYIGASGIALQRRLDKMISSTNADLSSVERQRLMKLYSRGKAMWAMGQRQGPQATVTASLAKLGISELMFDYAVFRADLAGADAMLTNEISEGMLMAPGVRIAGGTSQVQRNIIGERLLGLPREPKV